MGVGARASVLAKSDIPVMILSVGHDPVGRPCTLPGLTNDRVVFRHWVQNIDSIEATLKDTHTHTGSTEFVNMDTPPPGVPTSSSSTPEAAPPSGGAGDDNKTEPSVLDVPASIAAPVQVIDTG